MDLVLVILSTYFLGKKVANKGYSSLRWRIRHVSACIFTYTLIALISLNFRNDLLLANLSGVLGLIGIIIYRYQTVQNMEPLKK